MAIRNFTPHPVTFYSESQFAGLEQLNATTWVADATDGEPLLSVETEGMLRIAVSSTECEPVGPLPCVKTTYGELQGVPESGFNADDTIVVSLPTLSMASSAGHPLASQMACPYRVVRQRGNTSTVLGAIGLSK